MRLLKIIKSVLLSTVLGFDALDGRIVIAIFVRFPTGGVSGWEIVKLNFDRTEYLANVVLTTCDFPSIMLILLMLKFEVPNFISKF